MGQVVRRRGEQGPAVGREGQVVDPAPVPQGGDDEPERARVADLDVAVPAGADAANEALRARGVIVRAMRGYGLPECLRITVGTAEECALVADILAQPVHA